jgi:hypothetical protein
MAVLQQGTAPDEVAAERTRFQLALSELDSAAIVAQWTISVKGADAVRDIMKYCVTTVTPYVQTATDASGWPAIATGLRTRVNAIDSAARDELRLSGESQPKWWGNAKLLGTQRGTPL